MNSSTHTTLARLILREDYIWKYLLALCNDMQHPAPHIRVSAAHSKDPLTDAVNKNIDYDDIKTSE